MAPPHKPPVAASLIICESVLEELSDIRSAIRILSHLVLATGSNTAFFNSLTLLTGAAGDLDSHDLRIIMVGGRDNEWHEVASAPQHAFKYGHKVDPNGPGGYSLTTRFALDVTNLDLTPTFFVQAWLDGARVAQAPITLRR